MWPTLCKASHIDGLIGPSPPEVEISIVPILLGTKLEFPWHWNPGFSDSRPRGLAVPRWKSQVCVCVSPTGITVSSICSFFPPSFVHLTNMYGGPAASQELGQALQDRGQREGGALCCALRGLTAYFSLGLPPETTGFNPRVAEYTDPSNLAQMFLSRKLVPVYSLNPIITVNVS